MVFLPRKRYTDKPALIVELKWNKTADAAIDQIKDKKYPQCLSEYQGNMILAGINYDRETKEHTCVIEKIEKL